MTHEVVFSRRATIAYRVLETRVEIVSIAYGGRDFEKELRDVKRGRGEQASPE